MMGKIFSVFKRPFINYAVEERASRVIDKMATKPKPAPLYPTEERVLKKIRAEHPELAEKIKAKNEKLGNHLKQMKVTSETFKLPPPSSEINPEIDHPSSKLPKQRFIRSIDNEFGLPEIPPDKIPPGKISFRQAMEIFKLISDTNGVKEAEKLSADLKLDAEKSRIMLQYFRPFLFSRDDIPRHRLEISGDEMDKSRYQTYPEFLEMGRVRQREADEKSEEFAEKYSEQMKKLNQQIKKERIEKETVERNEDKVKNS